MCQGIGSEFATLELGDKRLKKRAVELLETLAADPTASINAACDGWSGTLAAYRFFDNPNVAPERILDAHREAAEKRLEQENVVLLV